MTVQSALAAAAGLVALAFSMSTFERWLAHRHRHELVWSVALALFFAGAAFLWVGASNGWTRPVFRGFYLFGAIVNVPVLALGTIYLLAGQRQGDRWAAVVALGCAFAAGVVVAAPMRPIANPHSLPQGSDVFGALPRVLAAVASAGGAAVVLGGAAWSAWRYRRGRMLWANVLIAAGTLILGASGVLNSVLGEMEGFAVTLAVGITVIYAGFLVSMTAGSQERRARRSTFPTRPSGRESTKVTAVGHL
jgi:hypothetical protein